MSNILKSIGKSLYRWGDSFNSTSKSVMEPDDSGFYPIIFDISPSPKFNVLGDDLKKYNAVFSNPALLKVFTLQCDLFSLGKIKVTTKAGVELPNDPVAALLNNPNAYQGNSQLLWDVMFNYMIGNVYAYLDSNVPTEDNVLYILETHKIKWPRELDKKKDKLILSKKSKKEIDDLLIEYTYEDNTHVKIPLSKIIRLTDLSNGQGNFFKGKSRIDSLYKILSNADKSLDATNINIDYSGKFMVAGQQDIENVNDEIMGQDEKEDIEKKMNSKKRVHAVKSKIDIKRFVENARALGLDESYRSAYFFIGSMYNIPRDVLEAYLQGSTFDNQEKSTAKHVAYTLQPKGDDFLEALAVRFGYTDKKISITWDHLPFMQVFKKEQVNSQNTQVDMLNKLLKLNVPLTEINNFLGTDFKIASYEQPTNTPTA